MAVSWMPYWKTVVMNWLLAVAFVILGAFVIYFSRNDGAFTVPVVLFLAVIFLIIPITCLLTAQALREAVPTAMTSWSFGLNITVSVFGALLLVLLYMSHRINFGVVVAFIPFVINIVSLTAYRADPTGRAI